METKQKPDVVVRVLEHKMTIVVDCDVPPGEVDSVREAIAEKLKLMDVATQAMEIDLDAWIGRVVNAENRIEGAILYEGTLPVPPVHGQIEWLDDFFTTGFVADEAGAFDFRKRTAKVTVEKNQHLATVSPPISGKEGKDVFGSRVKVRRAQKARIRTGKNVRKEGEWDYYADCAGRIRWEGHGLHVDNVYTIPGDVDLKTGDVTHPGAVIVKKDVGEGAEVVADGDVEVYGIVEKATIKCGGSLIVHGGIVGGENCAIKVGGSVQALYIMDAHVDAVGDVAVEKEILQSVIVTDGNVLVPRGRIVGGRITARAEVVVGQAGSDASVSTPLQLAQDVPSKAKILDLKDKFASLTETREKLRQALEPLLGQVKEMPPEKAKAVKKSIDRLREVKQEIAQTERQITVCERKLVELSTLKITVYDKIFPETRLILGAHTLRVRQVVQGPVKAILRDGKLRVMRLHK